MGSIGFTRLPANSMAQKRLQVSAIRQVQSFLGLPRFHKAGLMKRRDKENERKEEREKKVEK